jgi:hypothetical protein
LYQCETLALFSKFKSPPPPPPQISIINDMYTDACILLTGDSKNGTLKEGIIRMRNRCSGVVSRQEISAGVLNFTSHISLDGCFRHDYL